MAAKPANKLGLWASTSLVVGNMIGAGVFLLPAALAPFGSVSLLGWLFAAAGTFFLARVFRSLSISLPALTGGPYAYTRYGFGDMAGFLVGWGYWLSNVCALAAIAVSLVSALSTFFPVLATSAITAVLTGLAFIWLVTWVNNRGAQATGAVQLITTIAKLLPLGVIAIGGLFFIRLQNFTPFNSSGTGTISAVSATAAIIMYSFLGIESATIPAETVANPGRTIGRATMLGLLITTLVYILSAISIMGIIPAKTLQHSLTPYADAAVIMLGPAAAYWASAGVAIAALGALNGWTLVQGEMSYALAKDRLFPQILQRRNKKGAAYVALVFSSVIVSLLMGMNYTKGLVEQFKFLILLTTLTNMIPYLFCAAANVIVRLERARPGAASWIPVTVVSFLAFAYSLWAVAGSGQDTVYWGFILLMAGIPFYVWMRYRKGDEG